MEEHQVLHPEPTLPGSRCHRWLVFDEHTGTNLDPARHFIPPPDSGLTHAGADGTSALPTCPS
jgi:hypothetical protein